jgi:hypothetical protein
MPVNILLVNRHGTHNNYFAKSFTSILKQKAKNEIGQIIIVDNTASVMPSERCCGEWYEDVIHGIKVNGILVKEPHYFSRLLNIGLQKVSDDVIFMEGEDSLEPEFVSEHIRFSKISKNIGGFYSDYIDHNGIPRRQHSFCANQILGDCYPKHVSLVSYKALQSFDENLKGFEFFDFWLKVSEKYPLGHIPKTLFNKGPSQPVSDKEKEEIMHYIMLETQKRWITR